MPKKVKKTRGRKPSHKTVVKSVAPKKQWIRWGESYTNVLLGIIVVIIAALFVASLAKTRHTQTTSSISTANLPTATPQQENHQQENNHMYIVKEGDTLWTIAENTYTSGYNWTDIAKANNLENPDAIEIGMKLILPTVNQSQSLGQVLTPTPEQTPGQAIKTNSYVIQPGDSLWDIAVRAYADGYQWTKLAQVNKLDNPDLIFAGNTLQIPR
jgi:nucleoid-associated protein YgaU